MLLQLLPVTITIISCVALLASAQYSLYPRASRSCRDSSTSESDLAHLKAYGVDPQYGWYWDGQKCERCSSDEASCLSYASTLMCAPGYYAMTDYDASGNEYRGCVSCPTLIESPYYAEGGRWDIHTVWPPDADVQACTRPATPGVIKKPLKEWLRETLRAKRCPDSTPEQAYVWYGSVCWYVRACVQYNMHGLCVQCAPYYYLDEMRFCSPCDTQYELKTNAQQTSMHVAFGLEAPPAGQAVTTVAACRTCTSHGAACVECAPGYYLARVDQFNESSNHEYVNQTLQQASWCRKCPDMCACDGVVIDTTGTQYTYTALRALSPHYFFDNTTRACYACDSVTAGGTPQCATCTIPVNATKPVCQTCVTVDTLGKFYARFPNAAGLCVECPQHCYECKIIVNNTIVSCVPGRCMNGYRDVTDAQSGAVTCVPCALPKALRCATNNATQSEVITQCVAANTDVFSYVIGASAANNRVPPNINDYVLLEKAEGNTTTTTCVQNVYHCKTIENDLASCRDCYAVASPFNTLQWLKVTVLDSLARTVSMCVPCDDNVEVNCIECSVIQQTSTQYYTQYSRLLKCTKCRSGYVLNSAHQCVVCDSQCAWCKCVSDPDTKECLTNTTDIVCQPYVTTGCAPGYQSVDATSPCLPCLVPNCQNCSLSRSMCRECKQNYILYHQQVYDQDTPGELIDMCLEPYSEDGLYYTTDGIGERVIPKCVLMDTTVKPWACRHCSYGYRAVNGTCLKCLDVLGGFVNCLIADSGGDEVWYAILQQYAWAVAPQNLPSPRRQMVNSTTSFAREAYATASVALVAVLLAVALI